MSLSLQKGLQGLPQKIRSNALAESSTPQPTDFGVAVPLKYKSRKYSFMRNVPFHKLSNEIFENSRSTSSQCVASQSCEMVHSA